MFDFSIVTNWIHQMLTSFMPEGLAVFLECVVIGVCIILMYAVLAIILIYMERKICAFFQCRLGPMRVGKWGLLQVPCDVIKMLTKEIIDLKFSDRFLYNLAPFMVIIASFLTFACLPISKGLEVLLERFKNYKYIFEIETQDEKAENAEERKKRKAFYLRNGLQETGLFVNVYDTDFEILTPDGELTFWEYVDFLREVMYEEYVQILRPTLIAMKK